MLDVPLICLTLLYNLRLMLPTGTAIGWSGNFKELTEKEVFASVIDLVLNCGCFIYIGAWIPFDAFNATQFGITPWRLIILFVAVILLRRIPPLLLLYRWVPEIKSWKEALFSGHFGTYMHHADSQCTDYRTKVL